MNCLFDALFFPVSFFKKIKCSYLQSFFSILAIIFINLLSDTRLLSRLFSFFGYTAFLFILLVPVFFVFVLYGLDLLLVNQDKNHWIKTHLPLTYVPYVFLPLIRPMSRRVLWQYQFFAWIALLLLCLWSYLLLDYLLKKSKYSFLRFIRDVVFCAFFIFL